MTEDQAAYGEKRGFGFSPIDPPAAFHELAVLCQAAGLPVDYIYINTGHAHKWRKEPVGYSSERAGRPGAEVMIALKKPCQSIQATAPALRAAVDQIRASIQLEAEKLHR